MRLLFSHGQAASNKNFQSNTKFAKRTCEIKLRAVAFAAAERSPLHLRGKDGMPRQFLEASGITASNPLLTRLPESFAEPEKTAFKVDQNALVEGLTQRDVSEMMANACLEEKEIDVSTLLLEEEGAHTMSCVAAGAPVHANYGSFAASDQNE